MRTLAAILGVIIVGTLAGAVIVYSGWPNVAVLGGHSKLAMWVLDETMEHSVKQHAKNITPPSLDNPAMRQIGFQHYDQMCVTCHGAPGASRSEIGKGLHPEPPSLVTVLDDWKPAELFWITKNGVKMTGMPAFGKTHDDDEIWAIVAFLLTLPHLEPADYLAMRKAEQATPPSDDMHQPAMEMNEHHHDSDHHH